MSTGEKIGPEREEGPRGSRSFICRSSIKRTRWTDHIIRIGERLSAYRILLENHERKTPVKGARRRWVDTVKMDPKEIWRMRVTYICHAQDTDQWRPFLSTVIRVP
jgi:hypothetical protein